MFVWFSHDRTNQNWTIKINNNDVRDDTISAEFTRAVIGEESGFKIELENSGENYTGEFQIGHIVEFDFDLSGGATAQFKGKIDYIKKKIGIDFTLEIIGGHYQSDLLDITVIAEYTNTIVSDILKDLIDNNLTGFTYANVETINTTVTKIKWNNKPFYDCVIDLMNLGNCDVYVDNNKDFHTFLKNSKENENEAFVDEHDIIELRDIGEDAVDVRNKIIVYGEAGGLPVLYTSQDNSSQSSYGVKEKVIQDISLINETQTKEMADAENALSKSPPTKGNLTSFLMPQLELGYLTYVVSPPHDLTDKFRLVKYTFKVPDETMEIFFSQDTSISKIFKERIEKDMQQETIVNPYKMLYSMNFTFDDLSNVSSSSNIEVFNGNLKLIISGNGELISTEKIAISNVTQCYLLVKGEQWIGNATFKVSADGTNPPTQIVTPSTLTNIASSGNRLILKIELTSTTTLIDSVALLFK